MTNQISRTIDEMDKQSVLRQKKREHNRRISSMFKMNEISVPLHRVSQEIKILEEKHEREINELSDEYAKFVLHAKRDSSVNGTVKRDRDRSNITWKIGLETPFVIDNITLFTGDQVTFRAPSHNGRGSREVKGIVVHSYDDKFSIMSNAEIIDDINGHKLDVFEVKFVEHFMFLKHKEVIAEGNNGGEGFIVELS